MSKAWPRPRSSGWGRCGHSTGRRGGERLRRKMPQGTPPARPRHVRRLTTRARCGPRIGESGRRPSRRRSPCSSSTCGRGRDVVNTRAGTVLHAGCGGERIGLGRHISLARRPRARPSVTSSAYSRSPPTGSPLASRVTRGAAAQPVGEVGGRRLAGHRRVGGEQHLGHVAALDPRDAARRCAGARDRRRRSARARRRARGRGRGTRASARARPGRTGSSTTQISDRSRRASAQIGHSGSSARLQHSVQKPIRSFTSRIASASASASASDALQQVERQPLRGAPADARAAARAGRSGCRPRGRTRRAGYMPGRPSPPRPPELPHHLLLLQLLRRGDRAVDGRDEQVLQHLGVVGVDRLGLDRDVGDLERARTPSP